MIEDINFEEMDNQANVESLVYINRIGINNEEDFVYEFFTATQIDKVWMEEWAEKPACACRYLQPYREMYDNIYELKTKVDFILGQDSCCCSFQDVCDGCIALAYENIDGYEEYPPFRIIFHYGDDINDVMEILAKRDMVLQKKDDKDSEKAEKVPQDTLGTN